MNKAGSKMKLKSEAELVEYEKHAVEGLIEVIRTGFEEVGMGGLLHSLFAIVRECDDRAAKVQDEKDPASRAARQAIAEYLRQLAMMNRPDVAGAVDILTKSQNGSAKKVLGTA